MDTSSIRRLLPALIAFGAGLGFACESTVETHLTPAADAHTEPADSGGQGGAGSHSSDSGLVSDAGGLSLANTPIGRACNRDADCGAPGLVCVGPTSTAFGGEGPARGVCTMDCSSDATVCAALDGGSRCVLFSRTQGTAYCLQGCSIGGLLTAQKCHGRTDVACFDAPNHPGEGFCRPTCRNDADCGARRCDLGSGLCADASDLTGKLTVGSPCDPNAVVEPCNGFCLQVGDSDGGVVPGACFASCSLDNGGCGVDSSSTEPPTAACLFDGTSSNTGGIGDYGLCGQLCDCNDDCKALGRACLALPAARVSALGRSGYCGPALDPTTGAPRASLGCTASPPSAEAGSPRDGGPAVDAGRDAH